MSPVHGPLRSGPPGRQFNNSRRVNLAAAVSGQGPALHADPRLATDVFTNNQPLNESLTTALLIHRLQGALGGAGQRIGSFGPGGGGITTLPGPDQTPQPINPFGNPTAIGGGNSFEPNPVPEQPVGGGIAGLPFGPSLGGRIFEGHFPMVGGGGAPSPAAALARAARAIAPRRAINARFNPNRGPREPNQLFFNPQGPVVNYRGANRGASGY